jgi:hypothetical protein
MHWNNQKGNWNNQKGNWNKLEPIRKKDRKGIESSKLHSYPSMIGFLSRISLAF